MIPPRHARPLPPRPRGPRSPPADLAGPGDLLPPAARGHARALLRRARALWRGPAGRRLGRLSALGGVPRQLRPFPRRHLSEDRLALALDGGPDDGPLPRHQLSRGLLPGSPGATAVAKPPPEPRRRAVLDQLPDPPLCLA